MSASRVWTLILLLVAAACASRGRDWRVGHVAGSVDIADVVVPDAVRELVLTIYPTPRRVEYTGPLLPLADATVVDDASPEFDARLDEAGLAEAWPDLPPEGYILCAWAS